MKKSEAIKLLGGTPSAAARELGITTSAVSQWPEDEEGDLPQQTADRVVAHLARKHLPPNLLESLAAAESKGE